jgi:hypothetical protein
MKCKELNIVLCKCCRETVNGKYWINIYYDSLKYRSKNENIKFIETILSYIDDDQLARKMYLAKTIELYYPDLQKLLILI